MEREIISLSIFMRCPKCREITYSTIVDGWEEFPTMCGKCDDQHLMLELEIGKLRQDKVV